MQSLPFGAILPGLILILVVDICALLGIWPASTLINFALSLILLVLPWVTLAVIRSSPASFGYARKQFLRIFGWGMVAGGIWRILSILVNLAGINLGMSFSPWITPIVAAVVWVPLVEETFFRGYLGRSLVNAIGTWRGVLVQALCFTFHPAHLAQGSLALISVFGFGLLAGWLQNRFDSLWSAWGAHAFANLLPLLVYLV